MPTQMSSVRLNVQLPVDDRFIASEVTSISLPIPASMGKTAEVQPLHDVENDPEEKLPVQIMKDAVSTVTEAPLKVDKRSPPSNKSAQSAAIGVKVGGGPTTGNVAGKAGARVGRSISWSVPETDKNARTVAGSIPAGRVASLQRRFPIWL